MESERRYKMFGLTGLDFILIGGCIGMFTLVFACMYNGDHGKMIFGLLSILAIVPFFIGIYLDNNKENEVPNLGILKIASDENLTPGTRGKNYSIVYDTETKVMYVYGDNYNSSLTPLYNADGSLRLYQKK